MKKDNAKPTAIPETGAEPALPPAVEQAPIGQPAPPSEHIPLPEVLNTVSTDSALILQEEYWESAKLLEPSETTEQVLAVQAERQGKSADEAILAYLHEQIPRQHFYEQPVLLGDQLA